MKLATFNLESFGGDRHDPVALEPRIAALRPKLLELEADILCLQEVNAQKPAKRQPRQFLALDALIAATPYASFHRAESEWAPGKGPGDRHNLVVLSRYPILAAESIFQQYAEPPLWRPAAAEPPFSLPEPVTYDRPLLRVEVDLGQQRPLTVFAVHLRAPIAAAIPGGKGVDRTWRSLSAWADGYHLAAMKRTAQALELRLQVEHLFDEDPNAWILLAGDFNATGDAGPLRLLRADPDDTDTPALANRRLYQLDAALPLEHRQTVLHKGHGQALDHILASADLTDKVAGVRVFNAGLPDEILDSRDDTPIAGSFHAAMRAEFEL